MSSKKTKTQAGASAALPAELAAFWRAYTQEQFERGRRDLGRMVATALEHFFNRGSERASPALLAHEELEAFRMAVQLELDRVGSHLAHADGEVLPSPLQGHQFLVQRRATAEVTPHDAIQRRPLAKAFTETGELFVYRDTLTQQLDVAARAEAENLARLMEARQALQRSLTALAPAMYAMAAELLDQYETQTRRRAPGDVLPATLTPPLPPDVAHERQQALLASRARATQLATPQGFWGRLRAAVGAALESWSGGDR